MRGVEPVVEKPCRVIAVMSGGPDSFCYLVKWLVRGCDAHVISFNYGQKGSKELGAVKTLIERLSRIVSEKGWGRVVEHRVVDISFMRELWRGTQLTDESVKVEESYVPTVVVPIRNVLMATVAAAYAYTVLEQYRPAAVYILLGSHYNDVAPREDTWEPRYPDCSPECVEAMQLAFRLCHFRGMRRIEVWTPSREGLKKSENLKECFNLVGDLVYETWSCYLSEQFHCGRCESCKNRHAAFLEAGIPDCTIYEHPPGEGFTETAEGYVHKLCVDRFRIFKP